MLTAQELAVVDDDTFTRAGETLKTIKLYLKRVEEVFGPIVTTAHTAWKTALEQRKGVEQYAVTAERTIKDRMAAYEQAQERLRREAAEAALREQERLEAEERARVAAETARLQRVEEDRRIAEAAAAEQAGDGARAAALLEAPVVVPAVAPRPVFVPPPPMPKPEVAGISFRDDWDFEVLNEALIPREYMAVDAVKIRRVVKAMRGSTNIPGIRVIPKRIVAARSM
ncbi:MAG: hypothetical protein ACREK6_22000 [Candidatus Rokuibacteriota bacterium]